MLKKVRHYIESNHLIISNRRILVGVSGGIDSVVLLDLLKKLRYECVVAHCNFHLRNEESDRDADFVEKLAKKYNSLFKIIDFDTMNYAQSRRISIEMAARELRYKWFDQQQQETDSQVIAVAHHVDDSIETVLLNIIRGTGLKGITGIEAKNGNIVRPLLSCTRFEIEKYAKENNLSYVFDSTNALNDYTRNKIRNQILPLLSEINPSVKQTLQENITKFRGAWKIYEQKINEVIDEITFQKEGQFYIDIKKLEQQPASSTVLYEIIQKFHFNGNIVEDIITALNGNSGTHFYSETHCLLKDREYLIIKEISPMNNVSYIIDEHTKNLTEPIGIEFIRRKMEDGFEISTSSGKIHIDADKVTFPLTLRKWCEGDIFYPFGMKQSKKISDFFINQKLDRFQKENTWILLSGENIVWIVGLRLDNRYRVTENTRNILEITLND